MVTLVLIAGISVLLFAMGEARDSKAIEPSRQGAASEAIFNGVTESRAVGSTSWSVLETIGSVRATLSHDQDHDGNYDGIADPLMVLCCALVVALGARFGLVVALVGRLLLRLCEPPILVGSDYQLALERPG